MSIKIVLLGTACLALGACAMNSPNQRSLEWKTCLDTGKTHTLDLPPCEPPHQDVAVVAPREVQTTQVVTTQEQHTELLPVIHTYTLYFDLNKSTIRPQERATLDQIAAEIDKYHPAQVTVTGFTDTSGTVKYNQKLSAKRAQMVSEALRKHGVTNSTLDEQARGEHDLAVPTGNHVKEPRNRRVVVDFRK